MKRKNEIAQQCRAFERAMAAYQRAGADTISEPSSPEFDRAQTFQLDVLEQRVEQIDNWLTKRLGHNFSETRAFLQATIPEVFAAAERAAQFGVPMVVAMQQAASLPGFTRFDFAVCWNALQHRGRLTVTAGPGGGVNGPGGYTTITGGDGGEEVG